MQNEPDYVGHSTPESLCTVTSHTGSSINPPVDYSQLKEY